MLVQYMVVLVVCRLILYEKWDLLHVVKPQSNSRDKSIEMVSESEGKFSVVKIHQRQVLYSAVNFPKNIALFLSSG